MSHRRPNLSSAHCPLVGAFQSVEGILDHHILHLHHVTEIDNHSPFDLAFRDSSVLPMVIGNSIILRAHGERPEPPSGAKHEHSY